VIFFKNRVMWIKFHTPGFDKQGIYHSNQAKHSFMKPRTFLIFAVVSILVAGGIIWQIVDNYYERQAEVNGVTEVVMYKNPGCECCDKWAAYLEDNGYEVTINKVSNMPEIKDKYGVPRNLESCHTAKFGDYIVEGHVPVEDIRRLMAEQRDVVGLSAPGMPPSSPGMNTKPNVPYQVVIFKDDGRAGIYAKH
jgi:hypothetical protein